ncbi:hypothetical protein BLOT_013958 [Blomia tropicalis]|nr:hypothetical protein BLOT_013958 [Blomia tropicalis]
MCASTTESSESFFTKPRCYICKLEKSEEVKQWCNCYYHKSCLQNHVNKTQKSVCPNCAQTFGRCRIIKQRRPFTQFLCTKEMTRLALVLVALFFYFIYFSLIALTIYGLAHSLKNLKTIQLLIAVPGIIYLIVFCAIISISCMLFRQQYRMWGEVHFKLRIM